MKFYINST